MSECACRGSGAILVEGPCDAAPVEAPCKCLEHGSPSVHERATRAVLLTDGWDPAPLGPCGARASNRRSRAERIAANVLAVGQESKRIEITDEMVARATEALWTESRRLFGGVPYDRLRGSTKQHYRQMARVVLSAVLSSDAQKDQP